MQRQGHRYHEWEGGRENPRCISLCLQSGRNQLQIQQLRFGNTADRITQKGETYATHEIVDHIKILPKRSKERAAAISTVIERAMQKSAEQKYMNA